VRRGRRTIVLALVWLGLAPVAAAEWASGGSGEVPLAGNGTSWHVRATLNGNVRGLFLLDTGASFCVLAPDVASRLRLPEATEHVELHTANGVVRAPLVRLGTIDVGGQRARDVAAVVHPAVAPPLDGIIGLSFLNQFSYAVDPRRRMLRLR
jgi:aspartyl protease family protein